MGRAAPTSPRASMLRSCARARCPRPRTRLPHTGDTLCPPAPVAQVATQGSKNPAGDSNLNADVVTYWKCVARPARTRPSTEARDRPRRPHTQRATRHTRPPAPVTCGSISAHLARLASTFSPRCSRRRSRTAPRKFRHGVSTPTLGARRCRAEDGGRGRAGEHNRCTWGFVTPIDAATRKGTWPPVKRQPSHPIIATPHTPVPAPASRRSRRPRRASAPSTRASQTWTSRARRTS